MGVIHHAAGGAPRPRVPPGEPTGHLAAVLGDHCLYVLAVAARRYDILVHALCVVSNHCHRCHLVITDVQGRLPEFMRYLDSLVARAVNASLGRFEGFWATDGSYSAVEPLDPADVIAKIAYVLANPVAAGLVRSGAEWPGLWTAPEQIGLATLTTRRPEIFFDPKGYMPAVAELELTTPPRDKWKRIEALQRLKTFLREYRAAWKARRACAPNVLFPAGTYLLRVLHGVQCAGAA